MMKINHLSMLWEGFPTLATSLWARLASKWSKLQISFGRRVKGAAKMDSTLPMSYKTLRPVFVADRDTINHIAYL